KYQQADNEGAGFAMFEVNIGSHRTTGIDIRSGSDTVKLPRPRGIVFDLDGTLLDTEPLYAKAVDRILEPLGLIYEDHVKQRCMGVPSHQSAEIIIDAYALSASIEEFISERERHLRSLLDNVVEISGAGQFVTAVEGHIPIALATSTYADLAKDKLNKTEWGHLIGSRVYGDDPEINLGKPAPDIFLIAADRIRQSPGACVAFEDSPNGIQAAQAAGMTVIGIANSAAATHSIQPDEWIADYTEINDLLGDWLAADAVTPCP
ncbi:MAG: HAD-IA family hydrolase, partial [Pseudomonadota bacterium]